MARRCELTGKDVMSGNNVSHSNRRTRRRFMPNIQEVTLNSEILGMGVPLKIAASTIRTVEHNGGLDNYLLTTSTTKLAEYGVKLKSKIKKAAAKKSAVAAA
jgi:large subunit ribosomal protein L28